MQKKVLVGFYDISALVDYLTSNPIYIYILNIHKLLTNNL